MPRKVTVDELACEGHGRCQNNAPEVFQLDDNDISRVQLDEIPDDLIDKVERAIRTCPRQAITWVES